MLKNDEHHGLAVGNSLRTSTTALTTLHSADAIAFVIEVGVGLAEMPMARERLKKAEEQRILTTWN